jgi:hypothetical protein
MQIELTIVTTVPDGLTDDEIEAFLANEVFTWQKLIRWCRVP